MNDGARGRMGSTLSSHGLSPRFSRVTSLCRDLISLSWAPEGVLAGVRSVGTEMPKYLARSWERELVPKAGLYQRGSAQVIDGLGTSPSRSRRLLPCLPVLLCPCSSHYNLFCRVR